MAAAIKRLAPPVITRDGALLAMKQFTKWDTACLRGRSGGAILRQAYPRSTLGILWGMERFYFQNLFNNNALRRLSGIPYEIRTRVTAVKGRCPRPLDERDSEAGALGSRAEAGGQGCLCQARAASVMMKLGVVLPFHSSARRWPARWRMVPSRDIRVSATAPSRARNITAFRRGPPPSPSR